jgi:hypothetical protein
MKYARLILMLMHVTFVTGCDTLTAAQLDLVQQAQRGLQLENQAATERAQFVQNYYQLQRTRLDQAFDADVRETADLSPTWVIEHRKAYAAAIDVVHRQQSIAAEAEATSARNRGAINAALDRLRALLSIYQRGIHVFDQSQR